MHHINNLVVTFCYKFLPKWTVQLLSDKARKPKISLSERMTILIVFYESNHRDFNKFYTDLVRQNWSITLSRAT